MKYGIIGYKGRMGKEISQLFEENGNQLVWGYDKDGEFSKEVPEILIDFSLPEVFEKTVNYVKKFNVPLIIGTTGLSDNQIDTLKNLAENFPVVQSYNFSIGIQLFLKMIDVLKDSTNSWDVEITETHHRFKKDKPSGTAKMLKERYGKDVPISSLRLGNVPGDHTIYLSNLGEVLSISHRALSRRAFAEGVLKSAEFAMNKDKGFYTFSDII